VKKIIFLAAAVLIFTGIQFLANCSNPLEGLDGSNPAPPGPVIEIDTLYDVDTVVVIDSNTVVDTVVVIDTNTVIDTVIIIEPDPGESQTVCSRIASNQQEIVWMFRNQEGTYLLEFDASLESEHPTQTLSVDIDGQEFLWTPADNAEFITELYLQERTVIRITPHKPPSLGHAVYICLKVSKPED